MITNTNLLQWSFCILNIDLDLSHLSILELFGRDLDNAIPVHLGNLVGTGGVTHFLSDMTIIAWNSILSRLRNPFLSHLFFDVVSSCFLFIFNSFCIHTVLGKMTKICANKTPRSSVPFSHVIFYTIHCNVSKLSIVVTTAPSVVVPTK